jgi:peptidoglycan/xylan/chitin deacetylase (PgdA/CDA1 family)
MTAANDISIRIRRKLNQVGRDASWKMGLDKNRFENARGSRILVYHGICQWDHLRYNTLFLTLKNFEKQLQLYKKYFNIISLDDFYTGNFSRDRFSVCLTFDDGFANNYKYVLPLLEAYRVPASFFITAISQAGYDFLWNDLLSIAGHEWPRQFVFRDEKFTRRADHKYVSQNGRVLNDMLRETGFEAKAELITILTNTFNLTQHAHEDFWLQMDADQIRRMAECKWVSIGSHSYWHNDLAKLNAADVHKDLIKSRQFLEEITGKEVKSLAFPYGSYTRQTVEAAKKAGFSQLLATGFLFKDDRDDETMRDRLTVNPFISAINQMHANISGHYH